MKVRKLFWVCWITILPLGQAGAWGVVFQDSRAIAQTEYFEQRIRPILEQSCLECHGREKQQGGLRLDHRDGWREGGESGPAIVAGDPDASLLVEAVRYAGLEMPPEGPLSADEIDALTQWVADGAADPRTLDSVEGPGPVALTLAESQSHWAYRPLSLDPRHDRLTEPTRKIIDRYASRARELAGVTPMQRADRATLIRRVSLDLIGLPPTLDQIEAFEQDSDPGAYERLVDRLLDSPDFGRRWGRHWLDVVRFAESVTLRGLVFKNAWRYRDYVIDALNRDLPFNQFVREQIAGDLLAADDWRERQRQTIATTFLMLGNINYEEQDKKQLEMDVVDEQLDTIGRAFIAQTIGCARCHDHKFDPIPTADYYAMAGVLKSSSALIHENVSKWIEVSLPVSPADEQRFREREQQIASLEAQAKTLQDQLRIANGPAGSNGARPVSVPAAALPGIVVDSAQAQRVGQWQSSTSVPGFIGDGYLHDQNQDKGSKTITFQPTRLPAGEYEVRLAYTPGANRADDVPVTILHAGGESIVHVNQQRTPPIEGRFVALGRFRFEEGNQGTVLISNQGTQGHVIADAVQFLTFEQVASTPPPPPEGDRIAELQQQAKGVSQQLQQLRSSDDRPRGMGVRDDGNYHDLPIHIRGSVHQLGAVVPRGFLQVVPATAAHPVAADANGRLELADWLADPKNPLTARVIVNRTWHWLLGAGLVKTTDNFGTTGQSPTHPELLDALSFRFIEGGWSLKALIREIVLSDTYQLASTSSAANERLDPENRWLWRAHRKPLDAESLRDSLLQLAGQLEAFDGGPAFPPTQEADFGFQTDRKIRSVYLPVFRNALPEIFTAFDFPDPSTVVGCRNQSVVAGQALFLMNDPFVRQQALGIATQLDRSGRLDASIEKGYRWLLARKPTPAETQLARDFFEVRTESAADVPIEAWGAWLQALLNSPDFRQVH